MQECKNSETPGGKKIGQKEGSGKVEEPDCQFKHFNGKLHKMARVYQRQLHIFAGEKGLSPGQPPVLMTLKMHNGCTQKELCQFIAIKPATLTDILQRMEKGGLIYRKADGKDQRALRVYLMEKGQRLLQEAIQIGERMEEECFRNFTPEERVQFLSFMDRIIQNLQTGFDSQISGGEAQ